jgi:hypothetical protein
MQLRFFAAPLMAIGRRKKHYEKGIITQVEQDQPNP